MMNAMVILIVALFSKDLILALSLIGYSCLSLPA